MSLVSLDCHLTSVGLVLALCHLCFLAWCQCFLASCSVTSCPHHDVWHLHVAHVSWFHVHLLLLAFQVVSPRDYEFAPAFDFALSQSIKSAFASKKSLPSSSFFPAFFCSMHWGTVALGLQEVIILCAFRIYFSLFELCDVLRLFVDFYWPLPFVPLSL